MAINKAMRAALKALSYPDYDVKKNYKAHRQFVNLTRKQVGKPEGYHVWDRDIFSGDHRIPVRIFPSPLEGIRPVLLFLHGGGWVTGNIDSYNSVCTHMAQATGHTVISVDYRLAPEHKFPLGLEDCYTVAREIFTEAPLTGIRPQDITLIGDSAGGNLAAALSLMARDRGEFLPHRQILIYPAAYNNYTDTSPFASVRENGTDYLLTAKRMQDYMELYCSSPEDRYNPYFAPLLSQDFTRQPKTLIITAEYCPLRDEGELYGKMLLSAGNTVAICRIPDALHGFIALPPQFSHVKQAYRLINDFLKEE